MTDGHQPDEHDDCCAVDPRIARYFNDRYREIGEQGELPEMVDITRGLLGLLADADQHTPTLLELGCGSGALMVELLKGGATRADGVDLSQDSLDAARRRARDAGVEDRVALTVGDGSQVALQRHDWVVLDRVICCYAHLDRLMANAIGAAGQRVAFSVPLDRGWHGLVNRLVVTVENMTNRLRGRPCPGYVHSIARIERRLNDDGFTLLRDTTVGRWYAAIFERVGSSA